MTTLSDDYLGREHDADKLKMQAQEAVRQGQKVLPMFNAYARAITRNPQARVEWSKTGSCTDGNLIKVRLPIELGLKLGHDRTLCDQRDIETDVPLCKACALFEETIGGLYHEMAHQISKSFESLSQQDKNNLVRDALRLAAKQAPTGSRLAKLNERLATASNYVEAATYISPWLFKVTNALEDYRVNSEMMQARPGTRRMFQSRMLRVFSEGIRQHDGTVARWNECPENSQAVVGLLAKASGIDYHKYLAPKVATALDDPEIDWKLHELKTARSIGAVYALALPVLERLRRMNFCLDPDDVQDDPPPPPDEPTLGNESDDDAEQSPHENDDPSDSGDGAEGDDEQGSQGEQDDDSESSEPAQGEQDGEPSEPAQGEQDGEPSEPAQGEQDGEPSEPSEPAQGEQDGEPENTAWDDDVDDFDDDVPVNDPHADPVEWSGNLEDEPEPATGSPDEADDALKQFGGHDKDDVEPPKEESAAIDQALSQAAWFDGPAENVHGVNLLRWQEPYVQDNGLDRQAFCGWGTGPNRHDRMPEKVDESILGPALMRARRVFSDNQRGKVERNRKSGSSVNVKAIRRLITQDDGRIFQKRTQPGRKDYFVMIAVDVSGSTQGTELTMLKHAVHAQAEMMQRVGVNFAIYAHSGLGHNARQKEDWAFGSSVDVDVHEVKADHEPWDSETKRRLWSLVAFGANLDGHALEVFRKMTEQRPETDKILLYYTDGAMPAANADEERVVLMDNIKKCQRDGIMLVGVGIGTDSPSKYGLETVVVDDPSDVPKVIRALEDKFTGGKVRP